ncbi:MAG: hypothetical protein GF419_12585 [Ignavibacteriales bacterium]|nr:hypothetical protein [Ignavibacteriales bacterium]
MKRLIKLLAFPLAVAAFVSCGEEAEDPAENKLILEATATVNPTFDETEHGVITFRTADMGIDVFVDMKGLEEGKQYHLRVHEYGDCADLDEKNLGAVYDYDAEDQVDMKDADKAGDLATEFIGENGGAVFDYTNNTLRLQGPHSILGRSVVLYEEPLHDENEETPEVGVQPRKVACGVIGRSETKPED